MKMIVGLGNPGDKYEDTRHNMGFKVIDELSNRWGIPVKNKELKALVGKGTFRGEKVMLVKPLTFMNNSGEAAGPLANYYKVPLEDVIVVYDDICLEPGHLRLRRKGSAGGHNGMKSLIAHFGSENFIRVRVGVGEKPEHMDLADWVLGKFHKSVIDDAKKGIEDGARAVEIIISEGIDSAMNLMN